MTCDKIEKVYLLRSYNDRYHSITETNSQWQTVPTLSSDTWNYNGGGIVRFADRPLDNVEWAAMLDHNKGHLCHALYFSNGKVILL